MSPPPPELIIIGGGVAGAATALRAAQYLLPSVWFLGDSGSRRASRSAYVLNIDNMIGVHPDIVRGKAVALLEAKHPEAARELAAAEMHISTRDMVENVRRRIDAEFPGAVTVLEERVDRLIRSDDGVFTAVTPTGGEFPAPSVVLATGVMDRQPVIHKERKGRSLSGIHWVFPYANHETLLYCIRCEGHLTLGRKAAIIGAGASAAEIALAIRERYDCKVSLLTAGEEPAWGDRRQKLLDAMGVEVRHGKLVDIQGAGRGASLHAFVLEDGSRVEVELAFVAMGLHRVYNDLAVALGAELEASDLPPERRHVLVDRRGETTVPGLFVVGDMAQRRDEPIMKQIYTAQEYAVRAVDTVDARRRSARRREILGES